MNNNFKSVILYQRKSINLHAGLIVTALMIFPFLGLNRLIDNLSHSNNFWNSNVTLYASNAILAIITLFMVFKIYKIQIPILIINEKGFRVSKFVSFVGKVTTANNLLKLLGNNLSYRTIDYDSIVVFNKINVRGEDIIEINYSSKNDLLKLNSGITLLNKNSIDIFKKKLREKQSELNRNFKIYNF